MQLVSDPAVFDAIDKILAYEINDRQCVVVPLPSPAQLHELLRLPQLVDFVRRHFRLFTDNVVRIYFKMPATYPAKPGINIQFTYPPDSWFHELINSLTAEYELYEDTTADYNWLVSKVEHLAFVHRLNLLNDLLLED